MTPRTADSEDISFRRLITTCISARLLIDIGSQIFNPFLPIIAAGLNTDVVVMGRLVSLRNAMGLLAPGFGALADRLGYRRVMRVALLISALGMLVIGSSVNIPLAAAGMLLSGIGLAAFLPTLQAYLSARLPYAMRARGMGMLEYSWALTGIVGLSVMGQIIAVTGWRTPFFLLAAGLLLMSLVFGTLPATSVERTTRPSQGRHAAPLRQLPARIIGFFRVNENARSTYGAMAAAAFNYFAAVQFMIIHGAWFADQYGFDARALGLVALLFGCFDLTASVSVSLFTDRFGKWRSVLVGTVGVLVGYLLIPWLNVGAVPALLSAAFARGFFEFALVANLPLLSEQAPRQRGKVMSLSAALTLGSGTVAGLVSPLIYTEWGISAVAALSALCSAISLGLLITLVRERDDTQGS